MASLSGQSGSNGGQPYYDPQRGFVYLSSNVTDAPAATTYDQPIEDDDQNLDEIERVRCNYNNSYAYLKYKATNECLTLYFLYICRNCIKVALTDMSKPLKMQITS